MVGWLPVQPPCVKRLVDPAAPAVHPALTAVYPTAIVVDPACVDYRAHACPPSSEYSLDASLYLSE
jgi:hypothetical protein